MTAVWGEPAALSVTEIAAVRTAAEVGVKLTIMVQEAPAARVEPQLLVWPKLVALAPVTEMAVMARGALPGLDSAIGRGVAEVLRLVLGKATEAGLSVA